MAWAGGTQTITHEFGCIKIVTTNFDANGEYGTAIDLADYVKYHNGMLPKGGSMALSVDQTSGTTAVVAVSLQGSLDGGTTYMDIVDLTDCESTGISDSISGCKYDNVMVNAPIRHVRVYVTTVGAGNTLTTTGYIRFDSA
jgi:hypothetical protein